MGPSTEFQKLVYERLVADPNIDALVSGRVYDSPPGEYIFPYITFGPSDFVADDADCIDGREESLQLDVWCRDQGKKWPCKNIVDAVKKSLHEFAGVMAVNALVEMRVVQASVSLDPDNITAHGVVTLSADIEEH